MNGFPVDDDEDDEEDDEEDEDGVVFDNSKSGKENRMKDIMVSTVALLN